MLGRVIDYVLRCVLVSVLQVYLEASLVLSWECLVKQAGSVIEGTWECT